MFFLAAQVFRTEIIGRRLDRNATMPLMAAALATVAGTTFVAAALTHPQVITGMNAYFGLLLKRL